MTGPEYPFDLGRFTRPISTDSAEAQAWFDRGLVWTYGFHHEEAVRCFRRAAAADPRAAMPRWGIAYAAGPNYNKDWDAFDERELAEALALAHASIVEAQDLAGTATAVEQALITALAARYPRATPPEDPDELAAAKQAFADATARAFRRHGADLDVVAVHADALMNLTAWQLWDVATGDPAEGAHTLEAKRVLEQGMALPGGMEHPGLLHLYPHLMEMSPHPEAALPAADALRDLVPDAGHLVHMPTHVDVLCGDYDRVIEGNRRAVAANARFSAYDDRPGFHTLYHAHDHHFRIYGAMFAGRRAEALAAAADLEAMLTEPLLRIDSPPMADWLEAFVPMRLHVLIRFGAWDELLATPPPADPDLYAVTTATVHYARGVAYAASERVPEAEAERAAFRSALARVPDSRYLFNNTALDILGVAAAMLDGEIAYRRREWSDAFAHLRRAIALDDGLPYDEPWGWMQPTRHAYGALLLEQGKVELAEAVYRADLGLDGTLGRPLQHPGNVWSLHGYHECLLRLGKIDRALEIGDQLTAAQERADVPVAASCACRLHAA